MSKSIISEGKTTQEAIEKGLKELKVSKDKVDVKVLESENKKSFFSILTPRVVKVELTVKEDVKQEITEQETTEKNDTTDKTTPKTGIKMYLTEAIIVLVASTIFLILAVKIK